MIQAFITWKPNRKRRARLEQIQAVLAQYKSMGLRLTLRQLFYQLVTKNIINNTFAEYKNLGTLLSKARLAGLVDWEIIEDRVRQPQVPAEWSSIQHIIKSAVASFRLPRWNVQPVYVELWCEKDALSGVIAPMCHERHVPLVVNRGYSSSSAMYESSLRIQEACKMGPGDLERPAHIIYLGDFDPSGEDMVRDIRDRMATFNTEVTVTKLALNPAQVRKYKLPHNTAKSTDSRAHGFIRQHGSKSYEVDALPPEVLQAMVLQAITAHMDTGKYEAVKRLEKRLKAKLVKAGAGIK